MPLLRDLSDVSTLETKALLQTAVHLWKTKGVVSLVSKYERFYEGPIQWPEIREYVGRNMERLRLPTSMKRELTKVIYYVGYEIFDWLCLSGRRYGSEYLSVDIKILQEYLTKLTWVSHGTIEMEKMIAMLIDDDRLHLELRFCLACEYCLEREARWIWSVIRPKNVRYFLSSKIISGKKLDLLLDNHCLMTHYWPYLIEGRLDWFDSGILGNYTSSNCVASSPWYVKLFCINYQRGNVQAMEYFWSRFLPEEQRVTLRATVTKVRDADVEFDFNKWHFIFSKMDGDEAFRLILKGHERRFPSLIATFLENHTRAPYACRRLVERLMRILWTERYFTGQHYFEILKSCAEYIEWFKEDFERSEIFVFLWEEAPEPFRQYVVTRDALFGQLTKLLDDGPESARECASMLKNSARECTSMLKNSARECASMLKNSASSS